MNPQAIYKLHEEAFLTVDRNNGSAKLIKLTDDNYYFRLTLVASEIVRSIDGKRSCERILAEVTASYPDAHTAEILDKGYDLIKRLIDEQLIVEV